MMKCWYRFDNGEWNQGQFSTNTSEEIFIGMGLETNGFLLSHYKVYEGVDGALRFGGLRKIGLMDPKQIRSYVKEKSSKSQIGSSFFIYDQIEVRFSPPKKRHKHV